MTYLPAIYKEFLEQFPEVAKTYDALGDKCQSEGPLDIRSRRLVKLGIAMGLSSEGAVGSHARRALEEGITPEELRHAVLLGLTTIGFPTMMASMKWVNEAIEKSQQ